MQIASGGDLSPALVGVAISSADHIGRALGGNNFSPTSLAVSAVAGMTIASHLANTNTVNITTQGLLTVMTAVGSYGYLTSTLARQNQTFSRFDTFNTGRTSSIDTEPFGS